MAGNPGTSFIAGLFAQVRSLCAGAWRRRAVESEMLDEFRHHIELRTKDLIGRGLPAREALRQARVEFGHVERHREDAMAARGLRFFDRTRISWLDAKLGVRMLVKFPGLSLVSVIGMTVAIAIGAGAFGAIDAMIDPTLPLPEGERVVSIQNSNSRNPGNPDRQSLYDFGLWRDELTRVEHLAAFTSDRRNLITAGSTELVRIAEMTASGFRASRVSPVLGRFLLDEDEQEGATPVVVIGHDEWHRRFNGDPQIIGRSIRLGSALHTIVGVMPEGFRFPINHGFWVPLRLNPMDYEPGSGPALLMFGRLAAGSTLQHAQAELATIGQRMAAEYPESHGHLRPQVLPYTHPHFDIDGPGMALALHAVQLAISLLLVLVALNVAVLVYARTAMRTGEIAVRSALGASRRRIVMQLFVEAFVLSSIAAVFGLTVAAAGLGIAQDFLDRVSGGELPFWLEFGLSPSLVLYVAGLAIVAGVIVGVLPALKATGRRVQAGLQQLSSRGSRMQLGRTWTALIIVQVAIAVAVLPFALYIAGQSVIRGTAEAQYPAAEVLRATLSMEREESPPTSIAAEYETAFEIRYRDRVRELLARLESEPTVVGVAFANYFPGEGRYGRVEVERAGRRAAAATHDTLAQISGGGTIRESRIDPAMFGVLGVPILLGRDFSEADARAGATAAIVDRVFAARFLGDDVLGRRVRLVHRMSEAQGGGIEAGPWLEVVGMVPDFTVQNDFESADPKLYRPIALAQGPTILSLAVRVRGNQLSELARHMVDLTVAVDPALQLHDLRSAADAQREAQQGLLFIALGVVAVTASVLLLSAAGVYAMMSFTVARRRREIGIRTALGADPRRILVSIFARAGAQLGAGVLAGLAITVLTHRAMGGGPLEGRGVLLLPLVATLMLTVGLLAALGPARRGLAVQPTEALREE